MDKYALEVLSIGGQALLDFVRKEFPNHFHIVARDQDMIVLGNSEKNVQFSRHKMKVEQRYAFENINKLTRK